MGVSASLELRDVAKTYRGPVEVMPLRRVSMGVSSGSMVALMGPSGSGKTTLLNLAGLLDVPTSGEVLIQGVETSGLSNSERTRVRARHLGFVFQDSLTIGNRTVLENVALGGLYSGLSRSDSVGRARLLAAEFGLSGLLGARANTLSGGERQRAAMARALVHEPLLLLCDEPTGNLDENTSMQILVLLRRVVEHGAAALVVTHDPQVAAVCDRVLLLKEGAVVESGSGR